MATLKDYMVEILRSRDFEVEERDGYIYGTRHDVSVVVLAAGDMLVEEVQDFVRNVAGFPGRKVVASLGKADESVQAFLQRNGVHYWGREEIEHEIGSLHLQTVGGTRARSLIDEVISDELPARPPEPPEQSIPVIVESVDEGTERIVRPNFGLEDVKYLSRHSIQGYRFELQLVPHYLFHYVFDIGEGKQKAGIVAVNGLTGYAETWRWGFELVDSIEIPHSKHEPKVDFERARKIAEEMVSREHRASVETVRDYGHAEVIERKRVERESVTLEPKGLVYLPVWCVEGKGGVMIVNSSSGKIISERLYGADSAPETRPG